MPEEKPKEIPYLGHQSKYIPVTAADAKRRWISDSVHVQKYFPTLGEQAARAGPALGHARPPKRTRASCHQHKQDCSAYERIKAARAAPLLPSSQPHSQTLTEQVQNPGQGAATASSMLGPEKDQCNPNPPRDAGIYNRGSGPTSLHGSQPLETLPTYSVNGDQASEPAVLSSPRYKARPPKPKVVVKPRGRCLTPAQLKAKQD